MIMLIKKSDGLVGFSIFKKFSDLICWQTTKFWDELNGIMDKEERISQLAQNLKINPVDLIQMQQVHGIEIKGNFNGDRLIPHCDGIISTSPDKFLLVHVADCIPLFFYNSVTKSVGAVHAGWKGIIKGIVPEFLRKWGSLGNKFETTFVAIGPHIGGCCYTIDHRRASLFFDAGWKNALFREDHLWHLDLGMIVREQLIESGLGIKNIDAPISCTSCQNDVYYSFRKEKDKVGRMVGIIGVKHD